MESFVTLESFTEAIMFSPPVLPEYYLIPGTYKIEYIVSFLDAVVKSRHLSVEF